MVCAALGVALEANVVQLGRALAQEIDAATRVGAGQHDQRLARVRDLRRCGERGDVVAVHVVDRCAEALEAFRERLEEVLAPTFAEPALAWDEPAAAKDEPPEAPAEDD